MKIGIVFLGRHDPGGPISFQLAMHLKERADIFAVVSRQAENLAVWQATKISLIQVPTYASPWQAVWATLDIRKHRDLLNLVRHEKPDVLFFPMLHFWMPIIRLGLATIPIVITIHDPEPHPGILGRAEWQFERLCARLATRCVVLSSCFVSTLERAGIPQHKIDVIPHGELSSYYSDQAKHSRSQMSDQPTILFFGRITPYKGLEVLLKAFEKIEQASPKVRLLIVGAGNLKPFEQQLARLNRVQVVNKWIPEEQVDYYFHQARVLVAPYTSATQSGVIAIASNMGIPVIASRAGGISEQIEHGKTGILVEPGSVEDLVHWCLRLVNDRALAEMLGREAKAVAQKDFGWDSIAEKVIASCQRAIDSKRDAL